MKGHKKKTKLRKKSRTTISKNCEGWKIVAGRITAGRGGTTTRLFRFVAEKIPFEALRFVENHVYQNHGSVNGIYVAHDSMSYPRYIGRGNIFDRLYSRKRQHPRELKYFSFYVVESKKHERELETLLIHVTGSLLSFNEQKKRVGIEAGSIYDFEAGTKYIQRQNGRSKASGN
jgi:hypothetical protein